MKRTRHTPEQIVTKLREADAMLAAGRNVAQIVQALGVSEQTYNRWRGQFGGNVPIYAHIDTRALRQEGGVATAPC